MIGSTRLKYVTGFTSKLHIENYKIIDFKDIKEPEIVNTLMKLTQ